MSEEAEGRDEREEEKTYLEFGQEMFVHDSGKSFLFVSKRQFVSCWLSGDKSAGIFCASLLNKSRGEYSRYSRETAANKQKNSFCSPSATGILKSHLIKLSTT